MSLKIPALRREFEIRKWSEIIRSSPYIAVLQITGGRAWGRTNLKARILSDQKESEHVSTRFAIPKAAREGALRTPYVGLSELFRSAPSAVVYGDNVDIVTTIVKRARDIIDGAVLVGGRFGEAIVTARAWEDILQSEGERAEWSRLVGVLGARPGLISALDQQHRSMANVLSQASGADRLVRVLEQVKKESPP